MIGIFATLAAILVPHPYLGSVCRNCHSSIIWDSDTSSDPGCPIGVASNDYVVDTGGSPSDFRLACPASQFYTPTLRSLRRLDFFTESHRDLSGYSPENASKACFENEANPTFSTNGPMFWFHHAVVDRVWWQWQNANVNNTYAFFGGNVQNTTYYDEYPNGGPPYLTMNSIIPGDGVLDEPTPSSLWITEGDLLCCTYESQASRYYGVNGVHVLLALFTKLVLENIY
ncbi:hypothetical protein K469DRAFT_690081 [Zopfia rhizophila CBS 207.26]|uniref:Tyrosinase copper-binding domain-containing protein n=1 Tax=Zopfia rhizophila CBS 207.26 TaxID=1314779 RepID=A0A6A6DWA3_9PEZI|nr:hypothetical protein K469DRAFT_690081 [Zopfia rhizophila CBS 207.26]